MHSFEKKYDTPKIAVIIPVFNEIDTIQKCLQQPALNGFDQVIIVDGSSNDGTRQKLSEFTHFTQLHCEMSNRAKQMNLGAASSNCDLLLFLHADTRLPTNAADLLRQQLLNGYDCGCFRRTFTPESNLLRLTSNLAYWRSRYLFWCYGDQALYFSKPLFRQLSGYKELSSFEDLDICLRAKRLGKHSIIDTPIQTSARRFADAPLKVLLKDFALTLRFLLGLYKSNQC